VLAVPEALLLDEPDASLDDETAAQVARLTREFVATGGAVLRVTHAPI
jgi:ABC-type lipoprotein export system ATPase subunit